MNDIRDLDKILKIKVIGVGGAGNNAITRMIEDNVKGVSFYMINTETGTLKKSKNKKYIANRSSNNKRIREPELMKLSEKEQQ